MVCDRLCRHSRPVPAERQQWAEAMGWWGVGVGHRWSVEEEWGDGTHRHSPRSIPLQTLVGPRPGRHKAGARLAWLRCRWHGVVQVPVARRGSGASGTASSVPPLSLCCSSGEQITEQITDRANICANLLFSLKRTPPAPSKDPKCPARSLGLSLHCRAPACRL